ncbi:hypothetical protein [Paenibacillus apis]|uniref:Uncharacterized protein n=1 Tax=Paenibacillus apis TaxID=1792174 RepID=A0A920CMW0_9BACL|nr:hypothetical protein [Paenibacillus apis]GIO42507.1 hypothetical protein J41TS4_22650 [Paenibacillus apis]
MKPEQIERLKEAYNLAPVDGSKCTFWTDEGKEAYQDGFVTALQILGVQVKDLNC